MFTVIARRLFARRPRGRTAAVRSLRTRLGVEGLLLEARLAPALTPVSASAGYPYSAIVKLYMTYPNGRLFVGSGAMIDGYHVLTAGHNIYNYSEGGFASSIKVVPQMSGSYQPYGAAYMTYERTYQSYMNFDRLNDGLTNPSINDIGLLTLDRRIGNVTGSMSFGYDNNNARFSYGAVMNTAGYPAANGYGGSQMYFSSGGINGLSWDGRGIMYGAPNLTVYGGQSGSPLWVYNPATGGRTVYGVVVAGRFATRITQSIFNDIQNWRAADGALTARATQAGTPTALAPAAAAASLFVAPTSLAPTTKSQSVPSIELSLSVFAVYVG